jgi:3-oxoacyl-[acyl-carrier-protein] synthase-3
VPETVLTNFHLEKMVDTSDAWIVERTGIRERRIASDGEVTSDLAARAARLALEDAGVPAKDVDLVIVATVTPDMPFPSCACVVQGKIGASQAAAFDIGAGCTGFVYALSVAHSLVAAGTYDNVLVIGAETLSRIVNWKDRNTCVLFGDGAGAVLVRPLERSDGVIACTLGADGTRGDLLTLPGGGSAHPASRDTLEEGLHYIHMQGNQVYRFAVRVMVDATREVIAKAGLTEDDVDLVIPHQANQRLLDLAAERLGTPEKVYSNVARFGNTSAASIPIALDEASRSGKLKQGARVLLVAFGAGLTWGAAILRWCKGEFGE